MELSLGLSCLKKGLLSMAAALHLLSFAGAVLGNMAWISTNEEYRFSVGASSIIMSTILATLVYNFGTFHSDLIFLAVTSAVPS